MTVLPTEAISLYNSALAFSNRGDFDTALCEYRRAIQLYPDFIEAYNNLGELYSRMGKSSLAISVYQKALDINRNHRVLLNLGVEFYNKKDYANALQYFLESLFDRPDFLEGNLYAGLVYYHQDDFPAAERFLARVVHMDPQHQKANYILSYIYYEAKEYHKTIACLDRIKDGMEDRLFFNKYYGFCLYHIGRYAEAVGYLQAALESSPKYQKFRDYLGRLTYENKMQEVGDVDQRIAEMEKTLLSQKPKISDYTSLSMLYIFKGEYRKAEELLQSVNLDAYKRAV